MNNINRLLIFFLCSLLLVTGCAPADSTSDGHESADVFEIIPGISDGEQDRTESADVQPMAQEVVVNVVGLESDGDCTIIQCGDKQILIDSASAKGKNGKDNISALDIIKEKMNILMETDDGKVWDYIIYTHPDEDHIGNANAIFDYISTEGWSIGTIIDYDFQQAIDSGNNFYSTNVANDYSKKRTEYCISSGCEYFSAASLSENNLVKSYELGEGCTLSILYNYFDNYDVITKEGQNTSFDNNYSNNVAVCCLIQNGNQKLLFTGDLEEKGEYNLAKYHEKMIENVTFFKAGHHGSDTSNNARFVNIISPGYIGLSYNSSAKNVTTSINTFLMYTDYIYPSYVYYENALCEMFGDIYYTFDGKDVCVEPNRNKSENGNPSIYEALVKQDICWYDEMSKSGEIDDVFSVFTFDESMAGVEFVGTGPQCRDGFFTESKFGSYNNCTLVKRGHYDILIDCGSTKNDSTIFCDKLKHFITDGRIECLIVTHFQEANISQLIGGYTPDETLGNGIFDIFTIENLIDNKSTSLSLLDRDKQLSEHGFYKNYLSKVTGVEKHLCVDNNESVELMLSTDICIDSYGSGNGTTNNDEDSYSLITVLRLFGESLIFVGDQIDYSNLCQDAQNVNNVCFMRLPGLMYDLDKVKDYKVYLEKLTPLYTVIGTPLYYYLPNGREVYSIDNVKKTYNILNDLGAQTYFCGYMAEDKKYYPLNGDLRFVVELNHNDGSFSYSMQRLYSESAPYTIEKLID